MYCYNCGVPLTKGTKTREHIPQQNLFKGFPIEYKNNRITVPSCFDCNNGMSHIDDELRNFAAIFDDGKSNGEGLVKAFSSFTRKDANRIQVYGDEVGVEFDKIDIYSLFEKNAKGIYYLEFGDVYPKYLDIKTITETDEGNGMGFLFKYIYSYSIKLIEEWEISGHEDVFRYKIAKLVQKDGELIIDNVAEKPIIVICAMQIWKTVFGCTVGIDRETFKPKV
jgi:hypothetical protein